MNGLSLRLLLSLAGALAGLAFYLLLEEEVLAAAPPALHRFTVYFTLAAFPAFGIMAGPLPATTALTRAALLATTMATLVVLTGFRFEVSEASDILDPTGKGLVALPFVALSAALVPFAIAAGPPLRWRHYPTLFEAAWQAGIKALVALLFLGLFWAVYFLSSALLELANIPILDDLLDIDGFPYILSGAVLGLALAVACELDGVIATLLSLVLKLLRLLLPPVTAVVTLFVLAALLQGLDTVFSRNSAAATMLLMAAGATILVVATLGPEEEAPSHPALHWSLRLTGLVLPAMAAIAVYALWLRIAQYGWTPERILAALSAAVACLFIAPITLFALRAATGWATHLRQGFVWSAIGALILGALWFTPLLDAQRISAQSQLARLLDGRADPRTYPYWPLVREWGTAGTRAIAAFRASDPGEAVEARIAAAEGADTRYSEAQDVSASLGAVNWGLIRAHTRTLPDGAELPEASALTRGALREFTIHPFQSAIDAADLPEGDLRIAAIQGDFDIGSPGLEWMITAQSTPEAYPSAVLLIKAPHGWMSHYVNIGGWAGRVDVIEAIRSGETSLIEPKVKGLKAGPISLLPNARWN